MVHAQRSSARDAELPPPLPLNGNRSFTDVVLDVQRLQWQTLMAMQQSMVEAQQEWFDQWVSHWGGGVPLDG